MSTPTAKEKWLLCPSALAEAKRTGIVEACNKGGRAHACDGPREPFRWEARDDKGAEFLSYEPHCGSCLSDEEYGYWRDADESCCCIHRRP